MDLIDSKMWQMINIGQRPWLSRTSSLSCVRLILYAHYTNWPSIRYILLLLLILILLFDGSITVIVLTQEAGSSFAWPAQNFALILTKQPFAFIIWFLFGLTFSSFPRQTTGLGAGVKDNLENDMKSASANSCNSSIKSRNFVSSFHLRARHRSKGR